MDKKHDVDANDMMPQAPEPAAPEAMEQAQKDAAEERLEGGGYGG
jgi:hypothetical protein